MGILFDLLAHILALLQQIIPQLEGVSQRVHRLENVEH